MIAPQCYFCLCMCMNRSGYPALNALCYNCNKVGHYSWACEQSCFVQQKRFAPISRKCLSKTKNLKPNQQSNRKQKKSQNNSIELQEMESRDALVSFKEKCSIPVFVQTARFNALLDTGSAISAINSETLNKIKIHEDKLKNSEISFITGAGGTAHTVNGKIELELKIGGLKFNQIFYVIQDLCKSLILGTDFMEKQKACIDWDTKTLYLQEFSTYVNIINVSNGLARVSKTITVQPNGFANIPIKLSRTQKNHTVLLEPTGNIQKQLAIAKCLVINRPKRVFIQVANASNKNVCLTAGTIIATVSTIRTKAIYSIDENNTTIKSKYKHVPLDLTSTVLSDQQKQIFQEFINQNSDVFANDLSELGKCNNYYHSIITETEKPIQSQPYRTSPKAKLEIEKQVKQMLKYDIIEESISAYASPVVLVKKPNNEYRFAIDYRKLNAVTQLQTFPSMRLDDVFDAVGQTKAQIFSTLDLASGYWQIALDERTKHKTAFITHDNLYQFKRMPFGLVNAPATFQMLMNMILKGLTWKHCLVYIDDIIVWSDNFENHLKHLSLIFQRLRDANLTLKPLKCSFAKSEVNYLGHIISKDGIKVNPSKIDAVKSYPLPKNQHDVRSFLGLANYYRKFVKGYSKIALPLNRLLTKNTLFKWTQDCQTAFDSLKQASTNTPILAYPNFQKQFILSCDASGMAIGYVLAQIGDDDKEHVIAACRPL